MRWRHVSLPMLLVFRAGMAMAGDSGDFEMISPGTYSSLLREAPLALGNKRYEEAFAGFQRLACAGDKSSQAALGSMYLNGQGTARDDLKGYLWLKLAAEFDLPAYRLTVKKIEEHLTPAQLAYTGARFEELRSRYGLRATNVSCSATSSSSFSSNVKNAVVCAPAKQSSQYVVRRCSEDTSAAAGAAR